jgi:hypothetical protein
MFEAGHARKAETVLVQRDWRADGGDRRVRVTSSDIHIARRFGGVNMRISVPVPAYQGVLLDWAAGEDGAPRYRLLLAHRDRDLDVVLAETPDESAATEEWAAWAAWLGLPRLASTEADDVVTMDDARPAVAPAPRRGASSVSRRRPRFLARRKTGDGARLTAVFAGEREIVSYE